MAMVMAAPVPEPTIMECSNVYPLPVVTYTTFETSVVRIPEVIALCFLS